MRPRLHWSVPLALLTAVSTAAFAPAANAETVRGSDPRADVRYVDYDTDEFGEGTVVDRPTVDLTAYRVSYGTNRIQVVMRYQDLEPRGTSRFFAGLILSYPTRGGQTGEAELAVQTTPRNRAGTSTFTEYSDSAESTSRCATRHQVDYDRNQVTISMPSACIANARYVDAFAGTYVTNAEFSRVYVDVAPGDGRKDPATGDQKVRVRRG